MTTINDVAKKAGVSPVTVSRVLNGATNVHPDTRDRVNQAIADLRYMPNVVARSLRSRRTRLIALILPDITNPFWPTVARGVEDIAQQCDYTVLLCNTDENPEKQARYLSVVVSQQVDGVILAPCASDAEHLSLLRERSIPTVLIDRRVDAWEVDTVRSDSEGGARALVRHLIQFGHRRIAMLAGPAGMSTSADRVAGYRAALAEAGLPPEEQLVRYGEFKESSGRAMMHEVLKQRPAPTAVFAANNVIALGAIAAIAEQGLRIPHDVALVCFDDVSSTSELFPFLTVAAQPAYQMGCEAARLLFESLETPRPVQNVTLPTTLIVRHSCGSRLHENSLSLPLVGLQTIAA